MPDTITDTLIKNLSGENMWAHLEEFAKRVKLSGTPEELESFRYLKSRMDSYGFKTNLIRHDAYISLPGKAALDVDNAQIPCITHSFSRPSAQGGTRGQLFYAGRGTSADFAKGDARGKIAVIDGIASPAASLRATEAGAIGQIHVSPHEHKHEMCISSVWGSPTPETAARLPKTVVLSVAKADGERLQERLAKGETVTAALHAEVDTRWRPTPILVAEMASPNGGADEPFIMFSGHHDTWHYGVMDNGTANATMVEVARLCSTQRAGWRRGLRVCFWSGHSHGRYSGSTWYADEHWDELDRRCAAHVNIDSTGGKGATVLTDALTATELRAFGRAMVATEGQETVGIRMSRAGDQSFWGIGVPSMFMGMGEQPVGAGTDVAGGVLGHGSARKGAGFGWWWHTPDDTLDKIDPVLLHRDARIYTHTLWHLLHDAVLPLDYAAWASDFRAELAKLSGQVGKRLDLAPLLVRTEKLQARAKAVRGADQAKAAAINHALVQVSRALVPIDYTRGDRFDHDPALGQTAWPPLDPIRALASAKDGDEANFARVAAVRARNRVAHALDQANAALDRCLSGG